VRFKEFKEEMGVLAKYIETPSDDIDQWINGSCEGKKIVRCGT